MITQRRDHNFIKVTDLQVLKVIKTNTLTSLYHNKVLVSRGTSCKPRKFSQPASQLLAPSKTSRAAEGGNNNESKRDREADWTVSEEQIRRKKEDQRRKQKEDRLLWKQLIIEAEKWKNQTGEVKQKAGRKIKQNREAKTRLEKIESS